MSDILDAAPPASLFPPPEQTNTLPPLPPASFSLTAPPAIVDSGIEELLKEEIEQRESSIEMSHNDESPHANELSSESDDQEHEEKPALVLRKRRFTEDEMDLTPMVDVTFQLLIFFMVTASFALQKSIQVPTPDPDQQGATQQMQTLNDIQGTSIIVKIDASNAITIDDEPLSDPKQLNEVLSTKMRREQKTELLLTAHALAMHRTVIGVIDAANDVGMQKIRMTSRKRDSD